MHTCLKTVKSFNVCSLGMFKLAIYSQNIELNTDANSCLNFQL